MRTVEVFVFLCNLSGFASQFQHSHIRALHNFFGQEGQCSPKPEGARTPMHALVALSVVKSLLTEHLSPLKVAQNSFQHLDFDGSS